MPAYPKNKPFKSHKIREYAILCKKCTGCQKETDSIVCAHLLGIDSGKGTSQKCSDLGSAYLCFWCHAIADGRIKYDTNEFPTPQHLLIWKLRCIIKTHEWLAVNGYLEVK